MLTSFKWQARLVLAHGLYYVLTGIWAVVSIDTFQMITGPKTDLWLVRTVGLLLGVIGGVLMLAGWRGQIRLEVYALALGVALALMAIDVIYVALGRISRIYLADAIIELALIAMWLVLYRNLPVNTS